MPDVDSPTFHGPDGEGPDAPSPGITALAALAAPVYNWAWWLEEALRSDPFVNGRLVVIDGWRTRGRPPELFSFDPSGILNHHTGCFARDGHDPQSCINGIVNGVNGTPGPISQLLATWNPPGTRLDRAHPDPRIVLIAAGRANHAGSGVYRWGAPSGNAGSVGMEQCGPGPWPDAVLELIERADAAICRNRGWSVERVDTHDGYDDDSGKIDPSGPWYREPTKGEVIPWSGDLLRLAVQLRLTPQPPPPDPDPDPPPSGEDDPMKFNRILRHDNFLFLWVAAINRKQWAGASDRDHVEVVNRWKVQIAAAGGNAEVWNLDDDPDTFAALGPVDGPRGVHLDKFGFRKPTE